MRDGPHDLNEQASRLPFEEPAGFASDDSPSGGGPSTMDRRAPEPTGIFNDPRLNDPEVTHSLPELPMTRSDPEIAHDQRTSRFSGGKL